MPNPAVTSRNPGAKEGNARSERLDVDSLARCKAHGHFIATVYTGNDHKIGGLNHHLEPLAGTTIKAEERYLALAEISHVAVQF